MSIGHENLMDSTMVYKGASVFEFQSLILTVGPNNTLKGGQCFPVDCQIFPCIKTYRGTNVNELRTFGSSTWRTTSRSLPKNYWMLGLNATQRNGSWYNCYPSDQWNETNVADVEVAPSPGAYWITFDIKYYPSDCAFTMESVLSLR